MSRTGSPLRRAMTHLRPYTQPHFPIAVAAAQSPSGMQLAGKHGAAVLSLGIRPGSAETVKLDSFWQIALDVAAQHCKTMNREDWRLVIPVHIAESRQEAIEQARAGAARFQRRLL